MCDGFTNPQRKQNKTPELSKAHFEAVLLKLNRPRFDQLPGNSMYAAFGYTKQRWNKKVINIFTISLNI